MSDFVITKDGELKHYGVVGMKWGQRKAQKTGTSYTYKSHGQKKWEKKLTKAKSSSNEDAVTKAQTKLEFYKKRDENRQNYAKSTSVGKSVAKGILIGPIGSGQYNRLRAAGINRGLAFIASNIITSSVSAPVGYVVSRAIESNRAQRDIELDKRYGHR